MNVGAIDPISSAYANQAAGVAGKPVKKPDQDHDAAPAAPKAAPSHARGAGPASVASLSTPAAKVSISGVPASVKPEDRALYTQMLKALGGNVSAALAALAAKESAEGEG
jgi:hypothetical protein